MTTQVTGVGTARPAAVRRTIVQRPIIQVEEKVPILKGIPLSLQHLFAMFGASVLVPILFNAKAGTTVVDPSLVLLMNGVGTLIYLFICRGKAPAFLGSSFAFIAPTFACIAAAATPTLGFQHAVGGFTVAGLIFIIVSFIIRWAGREWLNVVLPPAAMGVIVALIGLGLASVATDMAFSSGEKYGAHYSAGVATAISLVTLGVVVFGSLLFRGFLAALPVLMGVIVGYVLAVIINFWVPGTVNFGAIASAPVFAMPKPVFPVYDLASILIIMPAALVVISEHIGHLFVTSNIVGRDVMAITRVYSVWVIGGAAVISILIAFFGQVSGVIRSIPAPVIGGISIALFGVIAASGLRMLIEAKVDYSKSRNLMLSAIVFVVGISGVSIDIGTTQLSGMVLATLVAMALSLVFWGLDKAGLSNEAPDASMVSPD